jgi:hypothetical protein
MIDSILQFVASHRDVIVAAQSATILLLMICMVAALSRLAKLNRQYARLTRNTSGGNLEDILRGYMNAVEESGTRIGALEESIDKLKLSQQSCLQRVGLVRFDAFEDVGGEQSFAVVVLDGERNGVALSSIYSRNDVRVYAKAIENGAGAHKLTDEEQRAIRQANGS